MHAVILRSSGYLCSPLLRIAGRPLITRQIQWLRTIGCRAVAVEVGPSPEEAEVARWLTEEDAVGAGVSLVLTARSLSPAEIGRRAGFPDDAPLLVIPADVVAGGALGAWLDRVGAGGAVVKLAPPRALTGSLEGADLLFAVPDAAAQPSTIEPPAWGVRVRSHADAMELAAAVLEGRLSPQPDDPSWGVQIHAPEISPGVWVGRGAVLDPSAELVAPVLVGAGAVVCAGARVGPKVCLGERAVIGAETSLRDAIVSEGTIVGEGLTLSNVVVEPSGLVDPRTADLREIEDPLVIAERDQISQVGRLSRALATVVLFVLFVLLPFGLLWRLLARRRPALRGRATVLVDRRAVVLVEEAVGPLSRLAEVARGARAFVGVSPWGGPWPEHASAALYADALSAPLGIFVVDEALAAPDDDPMTRLRLRAWYRHAKCFRVDVRLLLRCLRGRLRSPSPRGARAPSARSSPLSDGRASPG